ncbi:MAG: MFS transporter [bacterium]
MFAVVQRNPQFRKLWFSQLVSQAGDWLSRIAVLTLIGQLAGAQEALAVGGLYSIELAIRLLPTAAFGPLAGPVADRLPRRMVMITADVLRAGVVLGLVLVREESDLWLLYTLLLSQMSLAIFFNSARSGAMPSTVPPNELHEANILSAATWSVMLALGTSLGAFMLRVLDIQQIFMIDAGTYCVSAMFLLGLKLPPVTQHAERFRLRDLILMTDMRRAAQHVRSLGILPVLLAKSFWGAAGGYLVLISILGSTRFAGGGEFGPTATSAAGFATGMLYAARGLGTGIGPILGRRFYGSTPRPLVRQIVGGFFVAALGYSLVPFTPDLASACACVFLAHMGGSSIWVASTTLLQMHVHNEFRGRVFALEFLGMTLSFTVGGLLAGLYYDSSGDVDTTLWGTSIAVAILGLLWRVLARRIDFDRCKPARPE